MAIGNVIREYRKVAHLTQAELGTRVFKSAQVISNWERGYTTGITAEDIQNLAVALNIPTSKLLEKESTDYLLGNDDAPKPGYYLNEETARIANEMKERPELRVLFDASRRLTPEDLGEVDALIQAKLKKKEYDD